jgi:hypothetical protein
MLQQSHYFLVDNVESVKNLTVICSTGIRFIVVFYWSTHDLFNSVMGGGGCLSCFRRIFFFDWC